MASQTFLRVRRDGSWRSLEVEYLTKEERREILLNRKSESLLAFIDILCATILELENQLKRRDIKGR